MIGVEKKRLKTPTESHLRKTLLTLRFDFFISFFLSLSTLKAVGRSGWSSRSVTLCEDRACRVLKRVVKRRSRLCPSNPLRGWCRRVTFGGSLVRSARFGDLALHFWRKSRTKRWRLTASLLEEVSYETLVLETWRSHSWSWTQKWPVYSASVVRERVFRSWTQTWPGCSATVVRERAFRGRRSALSSSSLYILTHYTSSASSSRMSGNGPLFSQGLAPTFVIHCCPQNMSPHMLPTNGSSLSFVFGWSPFVIMPTPTMLSGHPVV